MVESFISSNPVRPVQGWAGFLGMAQPWALKRCANGPMNRSSGDVSTMAKVVVVYWLSLNDILSLLRISRNVTSGFARA